MSSKPSRATRDPVRDALLREATDLLAGSGFSRLTVRGVAQAAGCSTIGIYTHFGDKSGLVEAILLDAFADFEAAVSVVDSLPAGRDQLVASAHAYHDWALANPSRYLVMFASHGPGFTLSEAALEKINASLLAHTRRVAAAMDAGDLAAADPSLIAHHLWACVHGHVMLALLRDPEAGEKRAGEFDPLYRLLLDGVSSRATDAAGGTS